MALKQRLMEEKEKVLDRYIDEQEAIHSDIKMLTANIDINYSELHRRCFDGNEFSVLMDYLEYLGHLKTEALARKELTEKKIAAVRAELYEMLKEIKMLDALKEKTLSAARRAENKKHQKLLDEIALRLEGRKT